MVKSWLVQDQTVLGKDYSNLLIADSLLKTIWFINAPCYGNEALASPKANELTIPEQTATGKGTSNPFMADYFINNDLEYLKGGDLSRRYSTSITKTKAATYEIKWIEDLVRNLWSPVKVTYDKHGYLGTSHWVTRLTIMKKYDYGHLGMIEVRREDQQLYAFREDERYDLNVALRMFTRWIVIQRLVKDLQLGVKSYQKKLNLIKPNTFRSNLRNRTTYTAYLDPKGVIYKDQNNGNRLMRADELHKFSDGTLNDVRTALHDIASGIRMEYLPKRK
ncbi:hypothetical protein Tco_0615020 [Tanacetum coccineum]